MQRTSLLLLLIFISIATTVRSQTTSLKPSPEIQKLHAFLGHWNGEGEVKSGPWGPEHKVTTDETVEMILGGFFLQIRGTVREPFREVLWIVGYDPLNKNYPATRYAGDGSITTGTLAVDGSTWTFASAGKVSVAGKQYLIRQTMTLAADLRSWTEKRELSEDGNTWITIAEAKATKIESTTKE